MPCLSANVTEDYSTPIFRSFFNFFDKIFIYFAAHSACSMACIVAVYTLISFVHSLTVCPFPLHLKQRFTFSAAFVLHFCAICPCFRHLKHLGTTIFVLILHDDHPILMRPFFNKISASSSLTVTNAIFLLRFPVTCMLFSLTLIFVSASSFSMGSCTPVYRRLLMSHVFSAMRW